MRPFFLLSCLLFLTSAAHSQSIKMKIATVTAVEGEDVIAFETGDTTTTAASGVAGKARFELVKIKKQSGASTNEFFKRSALGTHTPDITFEFNDANANLFYKVSLKDVTIAHFSYLSPECAGCGKLYHEVWFDYAKIEVTDVASGNVLLFDRATNKF